MILVYAEKEDMGIRYAAALGGFKYNGETIETSNLNESIIKEIKKNLADKQGYLETFYNGKKYIVTWGWGHFGTLKDIKDYDPTLDKWYKIPLPFIPQKYEVKRIQNSNEYFKKRDDRQFELLTKMFNSDKCEFIINATDWEREGELIFAYVYDLTGSKKPYYRLRNTAKTEAEIRKAFSHLVNQRENYPYVLAARARSIADWCVGINMTLAGTLYLSKDRSLLNIGRVMTPTLNLIVQREKELQNFVEEVNYGIEGTFSASGQEYKGRADELFKTEKEAENYKNSLSRSGKVINVETKTERKKPPLLHNTNTLQIEANERYGYTLEQTLNTAQKLYENGYITYPRVDSQYLTEDKKKEMPKLLALLKGTSRYSGYECSSNIPDRYFNNAKIDGHDAIITTDTLPKSLTKEQLDIYDLIARRVLMAASRDVVVEKTLIVTDVDGLPFKSNGIRYVDKGWSELTNKTLEDNILPNVREGDIVSGVYDIFEQKSRPPQRYTEATIIKAMENCGRRVEDEEAKEYLKKSKGIGRPATRAAIVERLISTGYIERKKKALVPTDKGMSAIDAITIEDIKSPILTADWEKALDVIELSNPADSVQELRKFIASIHSTTKKWCDEMRENKVEATGKEGIGVQCPMCGSPMVEGKENYYCSGYKNGCKMSISKNISGKNISKTMVKSLVEKGRTSKLKGFKSKNGKTFDAVLVLTDGYRCPACNLIQKKGKCYKCGGDLVPDTRKIVTLEFDNGKKQKK